MLNITQKMLYTDATAKATQIAAASKTIPDDVCIINPCIFVLIYGSVSSSRAPISYITMVTVKEPNMLALGSPPFLWIYSTVSQSLSVFYKFP